MVWEEWMMLEKKGGRKKEAEECDLGKNGEGINERGKEGGKEKEENLLR